MFNYSNFFFFLFYLKKHNTKTEIDQFAEKAIGLGTLLSFRSLVSSATELVLNRKAPHIYMCIDNAHIQYTPNYYGLHEILPLDTLANVAGIYRNVDTSLRATVSGLNRKEDRREKSTVFNN